MDSFIIWFGGIWIFSRCYDDRSGIERKIRRAKREEQEARGGGGLHIYVEEHRGLGGNIIIRLDNGAYVGLIYSLLVFS